MESHLSKEEVANLNARDQVYLYSRYGAPTRGVVLRRTRTQVVVSVSYANGQSVEYRFRENGYEVGADKWHPTYLMTKEFAEECAKEEERTRRRRALLQALGKVNWQNMEDEQLEAAVKFLNELEAVAQLLDRKEGA